MRFKGALPIVLLLILLPDSGCTVYKKSEVSTAERIISENPVRVRSVVLNNNDTIKIDRSVALVEVNKAFIKIRYSSGDTLMLPSSEIRSIVVNYKSKSGSAIVSSIGIIGATAFTALVFYGIYYLFFVLFRGG